MSTGYTYWWPKIGWEVDKFNRTCPMCQVAKATNKLPQGLLHSLPIPRQPWGLIAMDFVGPFPPSKGHDYLWVVLCHLTSMVHLVLIKTTIKVSELTWKFIQEVVQLHGLEALDRYLELQGVSDICQLPHMAERMSKRPKNHH